MEDAFRRHAISANGVSYVLQVLRSEIFKSGIEFSLHLIEDHSGNANAAGIGQLFKPRCNVHAVAVDVASVDDDVTDIDSNSEHDRLVVRNLQVALCNAALNGNRALHSVDRA